MTQRSFIRGHREYLNKKFEEDHPDGQFVIQRRIDYVNIYVNFKRRTSHAVPLYPGSFGIEHSNGNNFYFVGNQNNSFGKTTSYKTLDKFLAACRRHFVKEEAIEEFLFFYNNRNVQGFVEKVKENLHFCNKMCKTTISGRNDVIWEAWTNEPKTKNTTI
jgi:hypothetical protein